MTADIIDLPVHVLGPVEPGSIILLDERALPLASEDNPTDQTSSTIIELLTLLEDRIGHRQFLLLVLPFIDGQPPAKVYGPDEFRESLRAALFEPLRADVNVDAEQPAPRPAPPPKPNPSVRGE